MSTRRGRSTYKPKQRRTWKDRFGSSHLRILAIVGIVVFLVVDVILIGLALNSTKAVDDHATPRPVPSFTSEPRSTESPAPTATPTAAADASTGSVPASSARFLTAGDATTLWRATAGSCTGTPAVIERSSDAGSTWQPLSTGSFGIRGVLSLEADNSTDVRIIGGSGTACTVGAFVSYTSGDFWAVDTGALDAATYSQPAGANGTADASAATIIDGKPATAACDDVRQIVTTDSGVVAVCPDGLHLQQPGVAAWISLPASGVLSVRDSNEGLWIASGGVPGCSGVSVQSLGGSLSGSSTATVHGCATEASTSGAQAVAVSGSTVWLWSGDRVLRSGDTGATWA
ncbi:hypothetical protein [Plantibacter sp. YIM 135249]|uniref:hypothetical protein n=1 Tax=Plantibacter sp. YIM 135249 TaxID=3423918 RepID=UPI003D32DF02